MWTKTYGGSNDDVGCAIRAVDDGYIVAGYTNSFGPTFGNVWLLKINQQGDTIWTKIYDSGKDYDDAKSIQPTSDGGYLLVGNAGLGTVDGDIWVIKTDANGDTIWTKKFDGGHGDFGHFGCETSDGGYIVVGSSYRNYEYRLWVLKLNSSGDTIWTRLASHASAGLAVRETPDHCYIVAGSYKIFKTTDKLWLIKLDSTGNIIWDRTYDDLSGGRSIEIAPNGDFIITGSTIWGGNGDMYLLRVDSQGNEIWRKIYDRGEEECGRCVRQTPDGGYIIVGYSGHNPPYLIYIVRTDSCGDTLWTWLYEGSGTWDDGWSVDICNDGGYIISGAIGPGGWDLHLIKTYPETKIAETRFNSPPVIKIFPNPFNRKVNLYFQLNRPTCVKISLYNILGEKLKEKSLGIRMPGKHLIPIEIEESYSGVYFLKAEFPDTIATFKIIKNGTSIR